VLWCDGLKIELTNPWALFHDCTFVTMWRRLIVTKHEYKKKRKDEAIQLQTWTGPEGSRRLRLPYFKTIGTWRWQGCQPYAPAGFTLQEIFLVLICCIRCGPDEERILLFPGRTELVTLVKTGSRAGRTHSQ